MSSVQPYKDSKRSTVPYVYLENKYKETSLYNLKKNTKNYVRPDVFSNARFTNVPFIYDRSKWGVLGYPKIENNNGQTTIDK